MPIENHTLTHPNFKKISTDAQRREICGDADKLTAGFGEAPLLFRPPYGNRTAATPELAAQCGAYVTVLWTASVFKGSWGWYDVEHLVPGDIILFHYTPQIGDDLTLALNAARAQGLHPAPLLDYLGPTATHPTGPPVTAKALSPAPSPTPARPAGTTPTTRRHG